MHAIDRPFSKIINGATQFVVPVFQRDYRWTETECEQLWNDILAIASNPGERGHFLGSVVYVATDDSDGAVSASGEVRSQLLRVPEQSGEANRFPSLLPGSSSRLSLSRPCR